MTESIYFRQLLAGRDFGHPNPIASQMVNYIYLIGDAKTKQCVVIDPAWDIKGIIDVARKDDMEIVAALASHYHPDHIGGDLFGYSVEGLKTLLELLPIKVHAHKDEAEGLKIVTEISETDLVRRESGDVLEVGRIKIQFIHTPGHTPGSQCFLVDKNLVSGDTLFVKGCGRVDLPGSDPAKMYESLTQKLAKLPDETAVYPGHDYGEVPKSTIGQEKRTNYYLQVRSLEEWMRLMG